MHRTTILLSLALTLGACSVATTDRDDEPHVIESQGMELPALETPADPNVLHLSAPIADMTITPKPSASPVVVDPPPPAPTPTTTELDDLDLPQTASPAPTDKEWIAASELRTTSTACVARVVREWMKVKCAIGSIYMSNPIGSVRVVSGDATNVSAWGWIEPGSGEPQSGWSETYAAAIFPVRRGDRRIMEVTILQGGTKWKFAHPAVFTVSELWLEGMRSPEISVTG